MSEPVIISFGEVLWDLFPDKARFGGAPANFACHAAVLGPSVFMVSAVGNDPNGRKAIAMLQSYGVDTSLIQRITSAPTGTVGVRLDTSGKPTFKIDEDSAWDRIAWSSELEVRIAKADVVYFGTLGQRFEVSGFTIRRSLDLARKFGIHRVLDINLRAPFYDASLICESVKRCSVVKLSDDELDEVAAACGVTAKNGLEVILRTLLERYRLDLVVLTQGENGALLVSPRETIDQAGIPSKVLDTVGAGDAFTATMITGLLRGQPLSMIARKACEAAATVCANPGAIPELPDFKTT